VFDTLLVRDGRIQARDAHLDRLAGSVSELYRLELPVDLRSSVAARAASLDGAHRLRVDAGPDLGGGVRVGIQTSPLQGGDPAPVVLCQLVVAGGLGRHKWADRRLIDSVAGPHRDALLVDRDGLVLESGRANVWLVEDGALVTPPSDGRMLPGVTRDLLLELAPSIGLEIRVQPVSIERAAAAEQLFLTSALRHVIPATLDAEPAGGGREAAGGRPSSETLTAIRDLLRRAAWT
jgi:para-aminobenzoate synthetase/4-amino-4-deoxychorismate lyase